MERSSQQCVDRVTVWNLCGENMKKGIELISCFIHQSAEAIAVFGYVQGLWTCALCRWQPPVASWLARIVSYDTKVYSE
jgi:hypothetical protein